MTHILITMKNRWGNFHGSSSRVTTRLPPNAGRRIWLGLNTARSSWVQGCDRVGQTSRCFIVCSSPHSDAVRPSSLNPHFCIRDLHRPVLTRRRFRLRQVGHASLEPGGSVSLGLGELVWCSLRVRALPSMGSTRVEEAVSCFESLNYWLVGSCSYIERMHRVVLLSVFLKLG